MGEQKDVFPAASRALAWKLVVELAATCTGMENTAGWAPVTAPEDGDASLQSAVVNNKTVVPAPAPPWINGSRTVREGEVGTKMTDLLIEKVKQGVEIGVA